MIQSLDDISDVLPKTIRFRQYEIRKFYKRSQKGQPISRWLKHNTAQLSTFTFHLLLANQFDDCGISDLDNAEKKFFQSSKNVELVGTEINRI